ncbi:MFS transporter [Streptomyces prunicolor]|jgi:DHA2 family methylenomycin A resistance protein-like MFS transporter|uniref:MFS transporter n=1 Tax=Streptomyces prunicolor TaxID=67348 RepID=UPI0034376626
MATESTTPTVTAASAPTALSPSAAAVTIISLAAGFVMSIVDTTVINIAGPEIQARLGVTLSGLTWVVDGYTLAFAALLLLAGSLAGRFGAKSVYLRGIALFVVASALCGAAPSSGVLIAGRLLQGMGAALCMPSSLALLTNSFPDPKQRARMVGVWASIISGAAALGPVLGGVLVGTIGWRSIFLLNIPIGIVGFVLSRRHIAAIPPRVFKPALLGHGLSIVWLAALCFAVIEGPVYGWSSAPILVAVAVAVLGAVLFVVEERTAAAPVLPRELLRKPRVNATNGISFLLNFGLFGVIFMFGLFIQKARGAGPLMAGLQMLPLWGLFVVGNILFTKITSKAGTRWPMVVGLGVAGVVSLGLATISADTPYWVLAVLIGIDSLCIGVTVPAMTASLMEAAGQEYASAAGSTLNATRQVGTLLGVAVVGAVLNVAGDWYTAASVTFVVAACCYLASTLLAWASTRPQRTDR